MEKRLVLAIVLMSVVWIAGSIINTRLFPPVQVNEQFFSEDIQPPVAAVADEVSFVASVQELESSLLVYESDTHKVSFDSRGAVVSSLQLKEFIDNKTGQPVELVLNFEHTPYGAFSTYLAADNLGQALDANFQLEKLDEQSFRFTLDGRFNEAQEGESQSTRIVREFHFKPGEFLFKVNTSFESLDGLPLPQSLLRQGYTLESAGQLGPAFIKLDGREAFRHAIYLDENKKRNTVRIRGGVASASSNALWAAIAEKYFMIAAIPMGEDFNMAWSSKALNDAGLDGLQLNVSRNRISGAVLNFSDEVYYYVGPRQESTLLRYNNSGDNAWAVSDLYLNRSMESHIFLGVLIGPLKWILTFIYGFVGNWGWAIVILTILVKLALLPSSLSSAVSMSSMTRVQPKLKALQEKYKDDKQELAKKQMELYQKEGVNPAGGCLPILIQMPILIALFQLFNQFFELRGAPWILWVRDLSAPDRFISFASPIGLNLPAPFPSFTITAINLLPILYVLTQMLTTTLSMKDNPTATQQMRTMMWLMPLIFFFLLYNMPSGLFLYWTVSNILGLLQQLLISSWRKSGRLEKMHQAKDTQRKAKAAKRAQMMAAYQQRLNQPKGKR